MLFQDMFQSEISVYLQIIFDYISEPRQTVVSNGDALTDRNPSTCVTSEQLCLTASNPEHRVTVQNVNNDRVTVQVLHGETPDDQICDRVEETLFTLFVSPFGCDYYKSCEMSWVCGGNRICEYQCPCPENGNCTLRLIHTNTTSNWTICDIGV